MKKLKRWLIALFGPLLFSCNYLDIVPDNIATVDHVFRMRNTTEQYLFTIYSYLPRVTDCYNYPTFLGGDELWANEFNVNLVKPAWQIAKGFQNVVNPYSDYWSGTNGGRGFFVAIRDCNTFLENIYKVPDMDDYEKDRWAAEATFLKAYYHFFLFRMYGPIPLIRQNLPITSNTADVKVSQEPVDSVVNYIASLLDEAVVNLPDRIVNEATEQGRVTKSVAKALKARLLVTAASPLFNGNPDYAAHTGGGKNAVKLFPSAYEDTKWERAMIACKEAIDECHAAGHELYYFNQAFLPFPGSPETITEMSVRNALCEKWNPEAVWTNPVARPVAAQLENLPRLYSGDKQSATLSSFGVPLKIAELYYTKNGVPISEDKTWNYNARYSTRTATSADALRLKPNYVTANLNFDREVRFYAGLGFDGGRWFGQGRFNDADNVYVEAKLGQIANNHAWAYSMTGYWAKKLVNPQTVSSATEVTPQTYPWPVIRLADLYLLYAEALNEWQGPGVETFKWIDLVRARAGLNGVEQSWTDFSTSPGAPQSKAGLRKIIHQERLIELAFEGQRFWDLRRWKEAESVMSQPITGWNNFGKTADVYYQVKYLFNPVFRKRDYLWPVKEENLIDNSQLVQSPGW
ncbi:RagB/SusD family nutrient uptake outer membrane protein [Chitinophaga sp. XS-30]|uniref:RagB/SusD family nutrient uptake outer membrane protein n=1 Tax=Chitinophaga sp. XS-30 TaxID=2604421 RepID=UPI0011DC756D|nr:RagB/SusD family nutrient uptake outer membrane protein [Chitinophaga sp. XS-30]QEH42043.1 RagB/SusD family nutrient uptake outer membrane protein [Chitinophaga sp. XS-30]